MGQQDRANNYLEVTTNSVTFDAVVIYYQKAAAHCIEYDTNYLTLYTLFNCSSPTKQTWCITGIDDITVNHTMAKVFLLQE